MRTTQLSCAKTMNTRCRVSTSTVCSRTRQISRCGRRQADALYPKHGPWKALKKDIGSGKGKGQELRYVHKRQLCGNLGQCRLLSAPQLRYVCVCVCLYT